ncbi:MAG TPA: hypothetical protein PK095_05935 [Myxococcota bacterium]|nr:hypothetical protein [Myxococcota bacterium]
MTTDQVAALRDFERYYAALDRALDSEDCDGIARLIEERTESLSSLVRAFSESDMPEPVRQRVELSESRIRGRVASLHAELMLRIGESRRRQTAASRYAEATR